MRQTSFSFIILFFFGLVFSGCASKSEIDKRQANAMDISGGYKVSKSDKNEVALNFEIANEGENQRHNIYALLTRNSPITVKETKVITETGANPETVFKYFFDKQLTLGKGAKKGQLDGGENISDDFGGTSKFNICSENMSYSDGLIFYYCLSGVVNKNTRTLDGHLTLNYEFDRETDGRDGRKHTEHLIGQSELAFHTYTDTPFYRQYLGLWQGSLYNIHDDFKDLQLLQTVQISLASFSQNSIEQDGVSIRPVASGVSKITFQGVDYLNTQENSIFNLDVIALPDYPVIQIEFIGPHNDKIIWVGEIWSLGSLTGALILIKNDEQLPLASFTYEKK